MLMCMDCCDLHFEQLGWTESDQCPSEAHLLRSCKYVCRTEPFILDLPLVCPGNWSLPLNTELHYCLASSCRFKRSFSQRVVCMDCTLRSGAKLTSLVENHCSGVGCALPIQSLLVNVVVVPCLACYLDKDTRCDF